MNQAPQPSQRVSAIAFPEPWALPGKPEASASSAVQHSYRQSTFLLGEDLRLFEEGMSLQLRIANDSAHSSFRKHPYGALVGLWSRTFLALSDSCALLMRGSYASCPPLARAACEQIAAQQQLQAGEMDQYLEWLAGNLVPNEEHKATDVGLGHYFAGETLAGDERLRRVYRPASDLGRPNFGATLLLVGPESNHQRLALTFADPSFHLGWAELVLGWLLALCERQLAVVVHAKGMFAVHDDAHRSYAELARRVDQTLAKPERCRIEEVADGNYKRYLVHNFRRASGGAPKRMLV
jgi:hypothetical protein